MYRMVFVGAALIALFMLTGCVQSTLDAADRPASRPVQGIGKGYFDARVEAFVVPPQSWTLDPPKVSSRHVHLAWISPSGDTAYGVIYASIPGYIPVALMPTRLLHQEVLERVMIEMRRDQGEAVLLDSKWNDRERQMTFEAAGGLYHVDSVLRVRGWSAWTLYVGRLRAREPNRPEIELASRARSRTQVGLAAGGA
jgi:hypothetical protein